MLADDFSFPAVPHFEVSPSLWRVSPEYHPEKEDGRGGDSFRKSLSRVNADEMKREMDSAGTAEGDEERMDMLWEDFNVEESEANSSNAEGERRRRSRSGGPESESDDAAGGTAELCCVQALKMSKARGAAAVISPKKPGMATVVKVLRRLLLLHSSAGATKKN